MGLGCAQPRHALPGMLLALLVMTSLAGCIDGGTAPAWDGPVRAFHVAYENVEGDRRVEATLSGPEPILVGDGTHHEAYRLEVWGHTSDTTFWFDGDFRILRWQSFPSVMNWGENGDPTPHGLLWPVTLLRHDNPRWDDFVESEFVDGILKVRFMGYVHHYLPGDETPYKLVHVSGNGNDWHRVMVERGRDLPSIPVWPEPPWSPRSGPLFPGAGEPRFGHPLSFQALLNGLLEHAGSARSLIEGGGCAAGFEMQPQTTVPFVTFMDLEAGESTAHSVLITIQGAPANQSGGDGTLSLKRALSPYLSETGERWLATTYVHPIGPPETDYELLHEGGVGHLGCDEVMALGEPAHIDEAWERVERLPFDWDDHELLFRWDLGHVGRCCMPTPRERYVFTLGTAEQKPELDHVWFAASEGIYDLAYRSGGLVELDP